MPNFGSSSLVGKNRDLAIRLEQHMLQPFLGMPPGEDVVCQANAHPTGTKAPV